MLTQLEAAKKREQDEKTLHSQLTQMGPDPVVNQRGVEHQTRIAAVVEMSSPLEEDHLQMIRSYQQHLLQQNRMHNQSVKEARQHLQEYQNKLKQRYPSISTTPLGSADTLELRLMNVKPLLEPPIQVQTPAMVQRVLPTEYRPTKQVRIQEHAQSLAEHSETRHMLGKQLERRDEEQQQNMGATNIAQLEQRHFRLLQQSSSSQEQMERLDVLGTSANWGSQSSKPQTRPGSVMITSQNTSVTSQPEARTQQVRFILPTENSSRASRTLQPDRSAIMAQKLPSLLLDAEAQNQTHTLAVEGTRTTSPVSFESSGFQQGPAETGVKTSFEQTCPHPLQLLSLLPSDMFMQAGGIQESMALTNGSGSLLNYSNILKLRERVLASSESIQAQQDRLKELQEQLDAQRESLLSRQRIQEELLLYKQAQLKKQMQRQEEALKGFLNKEAGQSSTCKEMTDVQKTIHFVQTHLSKEAENSYLEEVCGDASKYNENRLLSQNGSSVEQVELSQRILGREHEWRPSKPPLTKVKFGLDLEQHELSVIPEMDTPKSGRISAADNPDFVTGDGFHISTTDDRESSKCRRESPPEELSRITASLNKQRSPESPKGSNQLSSSWHEKLMVDTGGSQVRAQLKDVGDQDVPSYAAGIGRGVIICPGSSFRMDSMVALSKAWSHCSLSPQTYMQEADDDHLSSTTVSSGSFISGEKLEISPANTGPCSAIEERSHFSCPAVKESSTSPQNVSVSPAADAYWRQQESSEVPESQLCVEEMFNSTKSQIQRIIDKYTKDLISPSEKHTGFHAPAVGLDLSDTEGNFSNFHRQLFEPLEPTPDLDISSSLSQCRIFQDSKSSGSFALNPDMSETANPNLEERSNNLSPCPDANELYNILQPTEGTDEESTSLGIEEYLELLQLQSTLREPSQSADSPRDFGILSERSSEQKSEMKISTGTEICISPVSEEYEELARNIENINLQSSAEDMRSPSLSLLEEPSSFSQLMTTQSTLNETLAEHSARGNVESEQEEVYFEELPFAESDGKHENATSLRDEMNKDVVSSNPQHRTNTLEEETKFEISASPVQEAVQQSGSLLATSQHHNSNSAPVTSSGSCSLKSHIPVWETKSGRGIMEEPELTLISSSDISAAESDMEHMNSEENKENKMHNLSLTNSEQGRRGFLPLNPEAADCLFMLPDCSALAPSPKEDQSPSHKSAVMLLEFASTSGSLQEAFLKRKKDFIGKSSKRLEELKSRARNHEKPQAKTFQRDMAKRLPTPKEHSPPPPPENIRKTTSQKDTLMKMRLFRRCLRRNCSSLDAV
uniref:Centrosomal protein of 295 kDa n=1 Tax=Sphenodon punctatus TaxID=8508 RepID=A0A8D0HGE6_SPHPU